MGASNKTVGAGYAIQYAVALLIAVGTFCAYLVDVQWKDGNLSYGLLAEPRQLPPEFAAPALTAIGFLLKSPVTIARELKSEASANPPTKENV